MQNTSSVFPEGTALENTVFLVVYFRKCQRIRNCSFFFMDSSSLVVTTGTMFLISSFLCVCGGGGVNVNYVNTVRSRHVLMLENSLSCPVLFSAPVDLVFAPPHHHPHLPCRLMFTHASLSLCVCVVVSVIIPLPTSSRPH